MSFTPRVEAVANVLKAGSLQVPEYQRPYSWHEAQVLDLWDDLSSAMEAGLPEYFLGSIVLSQTSEGRLEVVDGQQRLATVGLLIAAIVDLFDVRSDGRAGEIRTEYLGKKDIATRALTQQIRLNADDNDLFRTLTLIPEQDRTIEPTRESHDLLCKAFAFLKGQLEGQIDGLGADEWQGPLVEWYAFLTTKARVLQLIAEDETRAFAIFETLNDRGINLNTADLLRNHVFGLAGARLDEVRAPWIRGFAAVSPDGETDASELFLKQYWATQSGVVRIEGLYKNIKPAIGDSESAVQFARDIAIAGPLWSAMYDRDSDIWSSHPSGTLDALDVLKMLNVEQCRPLLLSVLRLFDPADTLAVFKHVLNWSIRWIVAGGGGGGTVERLYASAAKAVTDGSSSDVAAVVSHFESRVPNDEAFRRAFERKTVNNGRLARYLLRALERARSGASDPELVPNENVEEVNLEHVLPKKPEASWSSDFSDDEASAHVLLMGNQALLRKSHNARIGNHPFAIKGPILAASDFALTSQVGACSSWTPTEITNRCADLATLAVIAWPRS